MIGVSEMRANLGQPGSLPKTQEQKNPLASAIQMRRKKKAMAQDQQTLTGPDLRAGPIDINQPDNSNF